VITPTLPNGEVGWISRADPAVRARRVRWSLRADLSARRLVLRRGTRPVKRMTVAIGAPGSPTPAGRFAVTDKLPGARFSGAYGCCILALSGHQSRLPAGWTGGNRLAIHGTYSTGSVGLPATAGCLRADNSQMAALMSRVPLGTPVYISR
jgi:lipoprotein-anchoring transpeptidase ErfK/SrfK